MTFYSFDLNTVIMIFKLELDIAKMYLHNKNYAVLKCSLKVTPRTDQQRYRHTDRTDLNYYFPAYANRVFHKCVTIQECQHCQLCFSCAITKELC